MNNPTPESLRPASLDRFVGQEKLKNVLSIAIAGANARKQPMRHSLFEGPPGLGKTTLANICAGATGHQMITASATSVTKVAALVTLLNQLNDTTNVLFIDEIHRLPRVVEEALYTVMEDCRLDYTDGKIHLNMRLQPFTLIGATTRQGMITKPLRDRFSASYHLSFYSPEELARVIKQSASSLNLIIDDQATNELAKRAKRTPRIANNLLLQSRDFALSYGIEQVSYAVTLGMMEALEIDNLGLTKTDRTLLETIVDRFNGGPVGLDTLAAVMVEERDVIEQVLEPYLLQEHLIERSPRGRVVTQAGYDHLKRIKTDSIDEALN